MCRYCFKTNQKDFDKALNTHNKALSVSFKFKSFEKQLLILLSIAKKDHRKEISKFHKKVVCMRKEFNKEYNNFLLP